MASKKTCPTFEELYTFVDSVEEVKESKLTSEKEYLKSITAERIVDRSERVCFDECSLDPHQKSVKGLRYWDVERWIRKS